MWRERIHQTVSPNFAYFFLGASKQIARSRIGCKDSTVGSGKKHSLHAVFKNCTIQASRVDHVLLPIRLPFSDSFDKEPVT